MCMEYQKGAEPPAGATIYRVPFKENENSIEISGK